MNKKKYHFNNKDLQNNIDIINSQINPKIQRKNRNYCNKNFYQISMPNHVLNLKANTFYQSEQSTLLTSEDYQSKNNNNLVEQQRRRNNCHCLCHQIEETLKQKYNNVHVINCHTQNINCHHHCFHKLNNNEKYRPIYKSVENSLKRHHSDNKNFELIYNY